jgi:alpha-1,3-rhamnosyltransferase
MTNSLPLVTVIVPSYNHVSYVKQCIDGILNQSYKNIELIVIDDGSTDGSVELLQELSNDKSFTLIIQNNIGLSSTLNNGLKNYTQGKYVSFCASDDFWLPHKIKVQVDFMEANNQIPMCYGKMILVDEDNIYLEQLTEGHNKNLKGGFIFDDIILINFHLPVTYLFRVEIFNELGYFPDNLWTEDLYMNLKISEKYEIGYINDFLACYRYFSNQKDKGLTPRIAYSHLHCINEFKHQKIYKKALTKWNLRFFIVYSSTTKFKKEAFISMFKSIRFINHISYIKAIFKLIFIWR